MIDYKGTSLANQVFITIEKKILEGIYSPGTIINEGKLCQDLGVSRTPVREALSRLELERLIKSTNQGIVVLGITMKDVEEIYMVKEKIEPYATGLAAQNMNAEILSQLKEIVEEQEFYVIKHNAEKVMDLDTLFHSLIYKTSGSPTLEAVLEPVHNKLSKQRKLSLEDPKRSIVSVQEHIAIYKALEIGDTQQAEQLMRVHIANTKGSILGGK